MQLYGVGMGATDVDPKLQERRLDLVNSAAVLLDKNNLIKYDRRTGTLQVHFLLLYLGGRFSLSCICICRGGFMPWLWCHSAEGKVQIRYAIPFKFAPSGR